MPDAIEVHVDGLEKLVAGMDRFGREIATDIGAAGEEAADEILDTTGLRRYPDATAANAPPTPYYIRGRGTQTAHGNLGNSERYGTQFYVRRESFTTIVGNRASYAEHLAGEQQARAMGRIGWRKLIDVAREKLPQIERIYQGWIDRLIARLGL